MAARGAKAIDTVPAVRGGFDFLKTAFESRRGLWAQSQGGLGPGDGTCGGQHSYHISASLRWASPSGDSRGDFAQAPEGDDQRQGDADRGQPGSGRGSGAHAARGGGHSAGFPGRSESGGHVPGGAISGRTGDHGDAGQLIWTLRGFRAWRGAPWDPPRWIGSERPGR